MVLDARVIGDEMVADPTPGAFVEPEPCLGNDSPFVSAPFDAVHVDDIRLLSESLHQVEERGVVPQSEKQTVLRERATGRFPVEYDRPRGAGPTDWNMDASHTLPGAFPRVAITILLAEHRDPPTPLYEGQREFLCKGFKSAVLGRYAARPEDC